MANEFIFGDLEIDGNPYRIDLESYRSPDIIDFAPRAPTPGGSIIHSELGLYQPSLQTDWRHGFGFQWHEDEAGYLKTDGEIDTRHDGIVMRFTQATASETPGFAVQGFTVWNGAVWAWGSGGLREYTGSWASHDAGDILWALAGGDYLFFSTNGARIRKINTSDVISNTGLDANATDYNWLIIHGGYIYAGKDGDSFIHFDSTADLSALEGNSSDTGRIELGGPDIATIGAVSFAGKLFVSREDGLWHIGEDRVGRKVLDYSNEISPDNFRSMAVYNGNLVYAIRDNIFSWNGARVQDITPFRLTDTFPYTTYGRFDNFVSVGRFLFMTARTNESTYTESLICWDGVGWHKLSDLITDGTGTISAMGYDAVNDLLWFHKDIGTDATLYFAFQSLSEFPKANFVASGTHSLITSRMAQGFRRVKKSLKQLDIEATNLDAGTYINVYFKPDNSSNGWILWDRVNIDGVTSLTGPGGLLSLEYFYLQLRFDLITDDTAQTPILEGATLKFIMRPEESYGYSFTVVAADYQMYGEYEDDRSAAQIYQALRDARNSKKPVKFKDIDGTERRGYLTALVRSVVERHTGEHDEFWLESRIHVNMVEV